MSFLSYPLLIFFLYLLPLICGEAMSLMLGVYRRRDFSGVLFRFLTGSLLMWAVFECVVVPAIPLRAPFDVTVYIWLAAMALVLLLIFARHKDALSHREKGPFLSVGGWFDVLVLVLAAALILLQCYMYYACIHLDEDDSYFLVTSINALEYNTMALSSFETGIELDSLLIRNGDNACAWLYYFAALSHLTGLHAAVIAHTLLPVALLLAMYAAYWLIADLLFDSDVLSCALCTFFVALICIYFSGSGAAQTVHALTRIWQGKAVVSAIIMPVVIFESLLMYRKDKRRLYLLFAIVGVASCSLSGMGIILGCLSIGIYGIYILLIKGKWKDLLWFALSFLPTFAIGLYFFLQVKKPDLFGITFAQTLRQLFFPIITK